MPKILIKKGDNVIRKLAAPDDILAFTVGSDESNDIVIKDERISLFHLQFEKQVEAYYIRDLRSEHGTFVNGIKISNRTLLKNSDEIWLGSYVLQFLFQPAPKPALPSIENHQQEIHSPELVEIVAGIPSLNNLSASLLQDLEVSTDRENSQALSTDESDNIETEQTVIDQATTNEAAQISAEMADETSQSKDELNIKEETADDSKDEQNIPESQVHYNNGNNSIDATQNYYLLGIYGYYFGRKFSLRKSTTKIGRDPKSNHIVVKKDTNGKADRWVSRRQATIEFKDGGYYIRDTKSKTRTWLNQQKLEESQELSLSTGDEIEILSKNQNHIFRVVEEGNWNFSEPRKTGSWFFRNGSKLIKPTNSIFMRIDKIFTRERVRNGNGGNPKTEAISKTTE